MMENEYCMMHATTHVQQSCNSPAAVSQYTTTSIHKTTLDALTMQVLLSVHACIHAQSIHIHTVYICTCVCYRIHVCFIEGYSEGNRGERGLMRGSYPV